MKIRLSELRGMLKYFAEVYNVDEESGVPGKWNASSGEPADEDDLQRLGEADEEDYNRVKSSFNRDRSKKSVLSPPFSVHHGKRPIEKLRRVVANAIFDEPTCMDCGLPGSDCDCSPSGRFE